MKMLVGGLAVLLLAVWATDVEACGRRRRRRCVYYCPPCYAWPAPGNCVPQWYGAPVQGAIIRPTPESMGPAGSYDPGPNPDRDGSVRNPGPNPDRDASVRLQQ